MNGGRVEIEANNDISQFLKLTYMTLRSTSAIPLMRLEVSYSEMSPCIHQHVQEENFDIAAFNYAIARLPNCIFYCNRILLGQSESFFEENGVAVSSWNEVFSRSRRRRYLFDGKSSLVAFISSKSDIDDVIPTLICLQIEWNKVHRCFQKTKSYLNDKMSEEEIYEVSSSVLNVNKKELAGLKNILLIMSQQQCNFTVQNYEASYCRYRKETEIWWQQIVHACPDIEKRRVCFVSSNTHSLINLISGFAESIEDEILTFADSDYSLTNLVSEYKSDNISSMKRKNILYYLLMKFESSEKGRNVAKRRIEYEEKIGILRIRNSKTLDVPTQIIDLKKVISLCAKKDCGIKFDSYLEDNDVMILNIDYPLGRTAYFILNKICEHVSTILGIYVIGKAASLFAERGDVLIPSCIYDQHTRNQYYFSNCITANDIIKYLNQEQHGIYDNQRAVTVLGTFLQNKQLLNDFLLDGITDLEMEAGPYLSAVYEIIESKRYPENESITFSFHDFDFGIVHYVSDNPLSGSKLSVALALDGIDATYAVTRAVVDKIKRTITSKCRRI